MSEWQVIPSDIEMAREMIRRQADDIERLTQQRDGLRDERDMWAALYREMIDPTATTEESS